jgi:Kef-type K+ transport system membrane component KefB
MRKYFLAYVLTILVFGTGIVLTIQAGKRLETAGAHAVSTAVVAPPAVSTPAASSGSPSWFGAFADNLHQPLSLMLVQLILIVLVARVFGAVFVYFGQPAVIGEMLAGIVLGPSLFGTLAHGAFEFVFPTSSLGTLRMLSQVGVILFMFVVGMELDVKHLRGRANTAVLVSHVSIILPYFLGVLASYYLFRTFAAEQSSFLAFALFMGTAMSITAFPVLARIIEERGLTRTFLGSTAITCAAVDDLSAWSILAFVVAIANAHSLGASVLTILLALGFIALMFVLVRPFLNRLVTARPSVVTNPPRSFVVGILVLVFSSALFTEVIGIHAFFGAFLAGVSLPAFPQFRQHLRERLENFSSAFLLPMFFAFTGLRTQIGLLDDWQGWSICLGLIAVATLGKLGGSMLAARFTGMDWHDSFALGALMNTRGLVGLIVLDVGLDLHILSPRVFAMMVVMALVTTAMTGPLLSLAGIMKRRMVASLGVNQPAA